MVAEACQVLEEFKQLAGWRRNSVLDSFQRFSKTWICFCQAASRQFQYQSGSQQFNCSVGLLFGLHHLRCHNFCIISFNFQRRRHHHHLCRFIVPSTCLNLIMVGQQFMQKTLWKTIFWSIAAMNCVMIKQRNSVNDIVILSRISYKETILQWRFSKFPQQNWSSILPFLLRDALGP